MDSYEYFYGFLILCLAFCLGMIIIFGDDDPVTVESKSSYSERQETGEAIKKLKNELTKERKELDNFGSYE